MFTDSHSHLQFVREFPDFTEVLERAEKAGVDRQVLVGCTPRDSVETVVFAEKHPSKFRAVIGVHPHDSNLLDEKVIADLKGLAEKHKCVSGIGEIGLDFFRNRQPHDVQERAFRLQLKLARELKLPVVIHVRDAWDEALRVLAEEGNKEVVMHCFSGNFTQARECWERGYHLAFGGALTYPKNESLRDLAAVVPDERILIETDCPYLPPQPYRGKRNEPAYIVETAKMLADIRGVSLKQLARITTENAVRVFRFPAEGQE
jgi:TatD DNase family protein